MRQTLPLKKLVFFFLFILLTGLKLTAQVSDSSLVQKDTVIRLAPRVPELTSLLEKNQYLNSRSTPVSLAVRPVKHSDDTAYFYIIAGLVLFLAILRTAYSKYFTNMFRVFFNSSLRQSQLTDQLVQDKLPSLLFNILFVVMAGLYFYFLMQYFHFTGKGLEWPLLAGCILVAAMIYIVKFLVLKFTGWLTGFSQEADIYTFIIFLINKIIGICLVPIVVVLAFADPVVQTVFVTLSFIVVGLLLLMRFFRAFGLLQNRVKVSRFHFFLYIFSLEILPLFLIYKAVVLFFSINQ
ncbi:MAG: hypothetical protein JWQ27_1017 [Ferruginibacter sp.]|nr:hypothetical protein [Ferruginibacter sp.]